MSLEKFYQLRKEFEADLRAGIEESRSVGAPTQRIYEMISRHGADVAAEKLVMAGEIQNGLRILKKAGRLDISVESIMLRDKYAPIFKPTVLEAARWRLQQV